MLAHIIVFGSVCVMCFGLEYGTLLVMTFYDDEFVVGVLNWHWFGWLQFHQYQVVGRGLPSETDEHPKIYRMKLWATNEVRAKSKFWWVILSLCIILAIEIGIKVNEFDLILFFVVDPTRRGHCVSFLRVLHGFYFLGCM